DLEDKNVGKFWQRVREGEPITLDFSNKSIASQIDAIRKTNKSRGAYGGPGWANYAASYYNDTNRYLGIIRKLLRRKGVAVIVIGNSIIQGVNLPVDKHIEEIGKGQRFQSLGIRLLRKKRVGSSIVDSSRRNGKKTNATLYESAVILSKP
ncbi:MAG: site-specific DNA-methyltransferase, partial [Terriglobia bacterium]